jgi:hypothetical protein
MNDVAYEKGANLLMLIEQKIGREKFDAFVKNYFARNSFKSKTTEQFIEEIKALDNVDQKIDLKKWIYGPGFPEEHVKIISSRFIKAEQHAKDFLNGKSLDATAALEYSPFEWIRFLRALPQKLSQDQMKKLDHAFHFTESGNSEVLFEWLLHVINSDYEPAYPALEQFLESVGRRKFVKPLFQELVKTEKGKAMASKIYKTARPNYHSVTQITIDKIIGNAAVHS